MAVGSATDTSALDNLQKTGKATTNPKGQLKVEDFIKMMVTQLQQQDPTKPADNSQMLSQMSQIGQLQSQQSVQASQEALQKTLTSLQTSLEGSLSSMAAQNNIGSASSLIGKDVEGTDAKGEKIAGQVQGVRVVKGSVVLRLEHNVDLPMSQVNSISAANADITGAVNDSAHAVVTGG